MSHDPQLPGGKSLADQKGKRLLGPASILVCIVMVPGAVWIALDRSVWPWDPAWYGQSTVDLFLDLTRHTKEWPASMVRTLEMKAPAICWLGQFFVPLQALLGSVSAALFAFMLGVFAGSVLMTFVSLRLVASVGAALLAGLAMASAPLLIGLSRNYFVEPLQVLTVCWFLYVASRKAGRVTLALDLVIATAFGLLVKTSTPAYVLAIGLLILLRIAWRRPPGVTEVASPPRLRIVVCALVTTSCVVWYARNWQSVISFVISASSGEISKLYGHAGPFPEKLWFWIHQGSLAFFANPWFGISWVALVVLAIARRLLRGRPFDRLDTLALASALQIGICLVMFARQVNEETRYVLPLLPYLGVLTAFLARELGNVVTVPLFVLFAVQFTLVQGVGLAAIDTFGPTTPWLHPCSQDDLAARRLAALVDFTSGAGDASRYAILGVEIATFNANSAALFGAANQLRTGAPFRCLFTSLGYAELDPDRAWRRVVEEIKPAFMVFLRDFIPPKDDPLNAVTEQIHARVRASDRFEAVALPGFPEVLLYRARSSR